MSLEVAVNCHIVVMKKSANPPGELNDLLVESLRHLTSGVLLTGPVEEDNPIVYVNPSWMVEAE